MTRDTEKSASKATDDAPTVGKGHPTPRRKEREAANRRPLVPNDRKLAKERDRKARALARERMMAGDEKYLPERDRGPQKAFARRYVDARTTVAEILIPAMVLILLVSLVPDTRVVLLATLALYLYIAIMIVDLFILAHQVKRHAREKFGADNLQRGLGWYSAMRATQMRRMRIPKPQNARGDYPS